MAKNPTDEEIMYIRGYSAGRGEPSITPLTSKEKTKFRWKKIASNAQGAAAGVYNVVSSIPNIASKFVTAPVDAVLGTNITQSVDNIIASGENKIKNGAIPQIADKAQKFTEGAVAVGGMMLGGLGSSSKPTQNRLKTSNTNDFIISQNGKILYRNPGVSSNNPVHNFKSSTIKNTNIQNNNIANQIDDIYNKTFNKQIEKMGDIKTSSNRPLSEDIKYLQGRGYTNREIGRMSPREIGIEADERRLDSLVF